MPKISKDFLEFLAKVIALLVIFSVVFGDGSIAQATLHYLIFAEPILIQEYLITALTVGSQAPGNFSSKMKTSGQSYGLMISNRSGIFYIQVIPPQKPYLKTKFGFLEPSPIITDCILKEKNVSFKEAMYHEVEVRKIIYETDCELKVCVDGVCD